MSPGRSNLAQRPSGPYINGRSCRRRVSPPAASMLTARLLRRAPSQTSLSPPRRSTGRLRGGGRSRSNAWKGTERFLTGGQPGHHSIWTWTTQFGQSLNSGMTALQAEKVLTMSRRPDDVAVSQRSRCNDVGKFAEWRGEQITPCPKNPIVADNQHIYY